MEIDPARARRRRGRLCPRTQVLTCGSDDFEVGRAGNWHEAFATRVHQPSFAGHQSWHRHALHDCPALDTSFENITDPLVDAAEERLKPAKQSRLDDSVGRQCLHPADRVRGLYCGGGAVAESSADVAELTLDARVRGGSGSPLLRQLKIDPLGVWNELRGEQALGVDDQVRRAVELSRWGRHWVNVW